MRTEALQTTIDTLREIETSLAVSGRYEAAEHVSQARYETLKWLDKQHAARVDIAV